MRPQINLFNNPIAVEIEKQDAVLQLELYKLQTDLLLSTKEINVKPIVKYPLLREFALKTLSLFGVTYNCEWFSNMKQTKQINRLTDEILNHLLRVSTLEIELHFAALSLGVTHPQN